MVLIRRCPLGDQNCDYWEIVLPITRVLLFQFIHRPARIRASQIYSLESRRIEITQSIDDPKTENLVLVRCLPCHQLTEIVHKQKNFVT